MSSLRREEIYSLLRAAGLRADESELTEVQHNLSAILRAMEDIDLPELNSQEPLPIIMPEKPLD